MKRSYLFILLAVFIIAVIFIAGCKDDRTKISSILERPEKYIDHNVVVVGEVTKTYGVDLILGSAGAYQIDDGTGRIWVLTKTGLPREGARIGLKGTVSSGIRLGREVFGAIIREEDRRMQ